MAINCNPGDEILIDDLVNEINSKEPSLGLGSAGQVLATNSEATGKEWIDLPTYSMNQTVIQDLINRIETLENIIVTLTE